MKIEENNCLIDINCDKAITNNKQIPEIYLKSNNTDMSTWITSDLIKTPYIEAQNIQRGEIICSKEYIKVDFRDKFDGIPTIIVTPINAQDLVIGTIKNITQESFEIKLIGNEQIQKFNWIAIG